MATGPGGVSSLELEHFRQLERSPSATLPPTPRSPSPTCSPPSSPKRQKSGLTEAEQKAALAADDDLETRAAALGLDEATQRAWAEAVLPPTPQSPSPTFSPPASPKGGPTLLNHARVDEGPPLVGRISQSDGQTGRPAVELAVRAAAALAATRRLGSFSQSEDEASQAEMSASEEQPASYCSDTAIDYSYGSTDGPRGLDELPPRASRTPPMSAGGSSGSSAGAARKKRGRDDARRADAQMRAHAAARRAAGGGGSDGAAGLGTPGSRDYVMSPIGMSATLASPRMIGSRGIASAREAQHSPGGGPANTGSTRRSPGPWGAHMN